MQAKQPEFSQLLILQIKSSYLSLFIIVLEKNILSHFITDQTTFISKMILGTSDLEIFLKVTYFYLTNLPYS